MGVVREVVTPDRECGVTGAAVRRQEEAGALSTGHVLAGRVVEGGGGATFEFISKGGATFGWGEV